MATNTNPLPKSLGFTSAHLTPEQDILHDFPQQTILLPAKNSVMVGAADIKGGQQTPPMTLSPPTPVVDIVKKATQVDEVSSEATIDPPLYDSQTGSATYDSLFAMTRNLPKLDDHPATLSESPRLAPISRSVSPRPSPAMVLEPSVTHPADAVYSYVPSTARFDIRRTLHPARRNSRPEYRAAARKDVKPKNAYRIWKANPRLMSNTNHDLVRTFAGPFRPAPIQAILPPVKQQQVIEAAVPASTRRRHRTTAERPQPVVAAPAPRPHRAQKRPRQAESDVDDNPVQKRRAPAKAKPKYDSINDIKDYTPDIAEFDNLSKDIEVHAIERKFGAELKLADTDSKHLLSMLHPMEQRWAAILRLPPQLYIINKRLIFQKFMEHVDNKPDAQFTKTHAQGACNIDVNKGSQLFNCFNSVGFLNRSSELTKTLLAKYRQEKSRQDTPLES